MRYVIGCLLDGPDAVDFKYQIVEIDEFMGAPAHGDALEMGHYITHRSKLGEGLVRSPPRLEGLGDVRIAPWWSRCWGLTVLWTTRFSKALVRFRNVVISPSKLSKSVAGECAGVDRGEVLR